MEVKKTSKIKMGEAFNKNLKTLRDIIPANDKLQQEGIELLKESNKEMFLAKYNDLMARIYGYRNKYINQCISEKWEKADSLGDTFYSELNNSISYVIYNGDEFDTDELGLLFNELWEKYISLM